MLELDPEWERLVTRTRLEAKVSVGNLDVKGRVNWVDAGSAGAIE